MTSDEKEKSMTTNHQRSEVRGQRSEVVKKTLVIVKYCGLQSGCGVTRSIALFNVVAGPVDLLKSTRTVESLEAEGYEVREVSSVQVSSVQQKEAA